MQYPLLQKVSSFAPFSIKAMLCFLLIYGFFEIENAQADKVFLTNNKDAVCESAMFLEAGKKKEVKPMLIFR